MIRLLIIGRDAEQWRQSLSDWAGKTLEVVSETLPAAGIRNFADNSPDAVAIAEPDQSPKIEPIIEAIRERPLGQIVPVVLLGASFVDDDDLHIATAVETSAGPEALVDELEAILDVELAPAPRHAQTMEEPDLEVERTEEGDQRTFESTEIPTVQADGGEPEDVDPRGARPPTREADRGEPPASAEPSEAETVEHPNYILEPLDEESEAESAPQTAPSRDGGSSSDLSSVAPPDGAAIRRKLNEVRHEDYFVILGVRRGADADEVQNAYREMKARFREDRLDFELADKFEAELEEINDALDDARAVLGDDRLRRAYREGTTRT